MAGKTGKVTRDPFVDVVHKLMRVDRLHHACVDARIEKLGITLHRNQHVMLMYIEKKGGALSQKEIAERFDVSAAAVANTLKSLEKSGLITRTSDVNDTRKNLVSVTEEGKKTIALSRIELQKVDAATVSNLTAEEIDTLNTCLNKIMTTLSAMNESEDSEVLPQ